MGIYTNRILNLKKIKAIGLDMDHTIVRYHSENFERLTFNELVSKLIKIKNYPEEIGPIAFEYRRAIRGLVLDKRQGNLVKISLYGRVKQAYHGNLLLNFSALNEHYKGMVIDLTDPNFKTVDTAFSLGEAALFSELVEFKDKNPHLPLPSYEQLGNDIQEMLDLSHRDGSLKGAVAKNLDQFIIQDPQIPLVLEGFKKAGKTLILVTNSDYTYTKLLLDYTFNPFLQSNASWDELFDYTITLAEKPSFFMEKRRFFKIDPQTQTMTNLNGPLLPGIYQGGHATALQEQLKMSGDEILYIGDHIFGDILKLKKVCHWRTALVIEEIEEETKSLERAAAIDRKITTLMEKKEKWEFQLNKGLEGREHKDKIAQQLKQINTLNEQLSSLIEEYQRFFNPYWGEVMRAGQEESRLMGQVAKYACIYMASIGDFAHYTPRHYFRPRRRPLPHEFTGGLK